MAVRIPVYERHVQLDAAAQTIPRYTANTETGKALQHVGDAMMRMGAHWQQKQDQFDKLQLSKQEAILHERIRFIIHEETLKFDPGSERPGTLHNRIMGRINEAVNDFRANAPQSQRKEADVKADAVMSTSSIGAAQVESQTTNRYAVTELDRRVGKIAESVQANPDSGHDAVKQVDAEIAALDKLGTITAAQKRSMRDGYMSAISNAATHGFAKQGRTEDGKAFNDQFAKDREREGPVQFQNREVPGTRPLPGATGGTGKRSDVGQAVDPAKYDTKLTPDEEKNFQAWKAKNAPNDSGQDYDLRGAFKAGVTPDANGHMPDTFKKPNHPTFSVESQYAKDRPDLAGRWDGQTYVPPIKGSIPAAGARTGFAREVTPAEEKLNEKRIAEIDKKPEIKAAIEKVANETGMDPKVLKVAASIESDGNPNAKTGTRGGLFMLTPAQMGMHGKNADINNPEANARAYVAILQNNAPQLEKALGRPPTDKELYLSHQQGVGGTVAHLKNPDQPAWKTMLSTSEGQQKGEAWAKKAVEGNIPKDVLSRLYGGDATKVTSAEMVAIQGTRFTGGNIDAAVTDVRMAPKPGERQTITADASGRVIDTSQNQQPRALIGGVDAGGPAQPPQAFSVGGLRTQIAYQPGQQFGRTATANAQPFKAIISHNTGGETLQSALETARKENRGYTFIVDKDGTVYQTAPLNVRTNHIRGSGEATRTARPDLDNSNSLGIAYVGTGKPNAAQLPSLHATANEMMTQLNITRDNVLGHGEVQGGSREKDEGMDLVNLVRTGAPAPVLTGDDGSGRPAAPAGLSRWQMDAQKNNTLLDGSSMKASSMRTEYDKKLKDTLKSDIDGIAANGKEVTLSKDMQEYFKTNKLSFDFVSNRLGTGTALTWQDSRQNAQKYYEATNNFNLMSKESIGERLAMLAPKEGSPNRPQEEKLYTAAYKTWLQIEKGRNNDPAAAADKFPDVRAARDAAYADPNNMEKAQALTIARMKAQGFLGIDEPLQTPITKGEARTLAAPLTALTDPDQTHSVAAATVAKNVMRAVGNDPELATKAMETVLREKRVTKETAAAAAAQLQITKDAMQQNKDELIIPGVTKKPPVQLQPPLTGYNEQLLYDMGEGVLRSNPPTFDTAAESGVGREGSFVPNRDIIPQKYIDALLANKNDSESVRFFNQTYGQGAAEHFIQQDSQLSSSSQVNQPPVVAADQPPPQSDFAFPLPTSEVDEKTDTSVPDPMEF